MRKKGKIQWIQKLYCAQQEVIYLGFRIVVNALMLLINLCNKHLFNTSCICIQVCTFTLCHVLTNVFIMHSVTSFMLVATYHRLFWRGNGGVIFKQKLILPIGLIAPILRLIRTYSTVEVLRLKSIWEPCSQYRKINEAECYTDEMPGL